MLGVQLPMHTLNYYLNLKRCTMNARISRRKDCQSLREDHIVVKSVGKSDPNHGRGIQCRQKCHISFLYRGFRNRCGTECKP